jgi:hypothetical protein
LLNKLGFQGRTLRLPRGSTRRGRIPSSRITQYTRRVVLDPKKAEFLASGGGEGATFSSVLGLGDNFRVAITKGRVDGRFKWSITVWDNRGNEVFSTINEGTLALAITSASNSANLSGFLDITLASGVTDVVYSSSLTYARATIV